MGECGILPLEGVVPTLTPQYGDAMDKEQRNKNGQAKGGTSEPSSYHDKVQLNMNLW